MGQSGHRSAEGLAPNTAALGCVFCAPGGRRGLTSSPRHPTCGTALQGGADGFRHCCPLQSLLPPARPSVMRPRERCCLLAGDKAARKGSAGLGYWGPWGGRPPPSCLWMGESTGWDSLHKMRCSKCRAWHFTDPCVYVYPRVDVSVKEPRW